MKFLISLLNEILIFYHYNVYELCFSMKFKLKINITPLHEAFKQEDPKIIEILLSHTEIDTSIKDKVLHLYFFIK